MYFILFKIYISVTDTVKYNWWLYFVTSFILMGWRWPN